MLENLLKQPILIFLKVLNESSKMEKRKFQNSFVRGLAKIDVSPLLDVQIV